MKAESLKAFRLLLRFERLNFRLMDKVLVLLRKEKLKCDRIVTIIITVKRNTYSYIY